MGSKSYKLDNPQFLFSPLKLQINITNFIKLSYKKAKWIKIYLKFNSSYKVVHLDTASTTLKWTY
jgi:hypothetical protein